jgi:ribosomal protein L32E
VNEEQLEEKKVALKDLLKNKISKKNTNESSDVKNVTQEIQYVEKIIERVVEKVLYQHPSDYKKVIGITGVPNTGKSITALMIASILSTSNKVAIIDKTENKGLKYYFVDDFKQLDLIKKFQPIQLKKTLHLYIYENNNDFISMISSLKNDYDIVIIDVDNIDKHLATFLDTIYIMTDIAAAHSIYVSTFIGNLINDINLSVKKIKIIYNKVTINDDIKIINKLNVCREVLEDSEIKLELICKELDYFILNQSIKGNKKLVNFDIEAYKADSDYLMQIEKIANDVFLTIKTNIKGTGIKNMFKRSKK